MVCPRDGEGCSQTLHRNYLLPISPNLEQSEMDKPVAGVGNDTSLTPVPSVNDTPIEAELSGTVTPSLMSGTPENSPDWPAPLRHDTQTTRNQLPLRYQHESMCIIFMLCVALCQTYDSVNYAFCIISLNDFCPHILSLFCFMYRFHYILESVYWFHSIVVLLKYVPVWCCVWICQVWSLSE